MVKRLHLRRKKIKNQNHIVIILLKKIYLLNNTMATDYKQRVEKALIDQAENDKNAGPREVGYVSFGHPKNFRITRISALDDEMSLASQVVTDGVIRPAITRRSEKLLEDESTSVKDFLPASPGAKDNWLHSLAHEEA
jgi:hypothetical protein